MNVSEMHQQIDLDTNQVGANKTRKYLPEEKDRALNKIQNRFIQSKIRPRSDGSGGFETDQISADAIRTLIVSGTPLTPYITDTNKYTCFLPHDYAYLLSDWSLTKDLCGKQAESVLSHFWLYGLRQNITLKEGAPFYETMNVVFPHNSVIIKTDLPYQQEYTGYPRKKDIVNLIPWVAHKGGYYWGRYGNIIRDGYYIYASNTELTDTAQLYIDSQETTNKFVEPRSYAVHLNGDTLVDNRLTASNRISTMFTDPFKKTFYKAPISELVGNELYIHRDSSFIVSKVAITYVRKPQPISLSLGTDSELPEEFHQTLCDLTVEYLKGTLENQVGYALKKDDNNTRVTL